MQEQARSRSFRPHYMTLFSFLFSAINVNLFMKAGQIQGRGDAGACEVALTQARKPLCCRVLSGPRYLFLTHKGKLSIQGNYPYLQFCLPGQYLVWSCLDVALNSAFSVVNLQTPISGHSRLCVYRQLFCFGILALHSDCYSAFSIGFCKNFLLQSQSKSFPPAKINHSPQNESSKSAVLHHSPKLEGQRHPIVERKAFVGTTWRISAAIHLLDNGQLKRSREEKLRTSLTLLIFWWYE